MPQTFIGLVHGNTITFDAMILPLEGQRVRVIVEPIDQAEIILSVEENARLLKEWVEQGPQGPIENIEGEIFP